MVGCSPVALFALMAVPAVQGLTGAADGALLASALRYPAEAGWNSSDYRGVVEVWALLEFATATASLGDLDGDGHVDVAVGAPKDGYAIAPPLGGLDHCRRCGTVFILFTDGAGGVRNYTTISPIGGGGFVPTQHPPTDGEFGRSLAAADIDGDGVTDLAVRSHRWTPLLFLAKAAPAPSPSPVLPRPSSRPALDKRAPWPSVHPRVRPCATPRRAGWHLPSEGERVAALPPRQRDGEKPGAPLRGHPWRGRADQAQLRVRLLPGLLAQRHPRHAAAKAAALAAAVAATALAAAVAATTLAAAAFAASVTTSPLAPALSTTAIATAVAAPTVATAFAPASIAAPCAASLGPDVVRR